jgi:hypothetical protein
MGMDAWFFSRMDYQERDKMVDNRSMEFITQSPYNNKLFTHIQYYHYSSPKNFDTEGYTGDPIISVFDIKFRCNYLANYLKKMTQDYASDTLFHTIGEDFNYQHAYDNFKAWDRVIGYVNSHRDVYNITLQYSTPDQYVKEISQQ